MTTQVPDSGWQARFFTIWGGQAFSLIGSALVRFSLIWWLTSETESATVLTTATLVSMLPFIVLAPLSGALVDRWNRRWVMIISDALIALLTAVLAYLYWIDEKVKKETLKARKEGKTFPEIEQVIDDYRNNNN